MICDMMEKTKRTYQIDQDLVDALDQWGQRTRVKPSEAAQLGLYIVMQLPSEAREEMFVRMDARTDIELPWPQTEPGRVVEAAAKGRGPRRSGETPA